MGKAVAGVGTRVSPDYQPDQDYHGLYQPPRTEEADRFLAAFGRMMVAWNTTESILRLMLEVLVDADRGAGRATLYALSAETSGAALETAVASLAPHVLKRPQADEMLYAIKLVGLVRGYRNYYAHGISHVMGERGQILTVSAKRTIKRHQQAIKTEDLEQVASWCVAASDFMKRLIDWWYPVSIDGNTPQQPLRPAQPPECKKAASSFPAHPR